MKKTEVNHILFCIEKICENTRRPAKYNDDKLNVENDYTKEVAQFLNCSDRQACFFSIMFSISLQRPEIDLDDISTFLKCSILSVFKYINDFDELVKLKLIRKSKSDRRRRRCPDRLDSLKFYVPTHIIQSIANGDKQLPTRQKSNLTVYEVLSVYGNLLQERYNELLTQEEFEEESIALVGENKQLQLFKEIKKFKIDITELLLLLYVCAEFTDFEEANLITFLKTYLSNSTDQMAVRKEFMKGENRLQVLKLLDTPSDDFRSDSTLILTEYSKELLFGEDKDLFIKQDHRKSDIILSKEIIQQRLFFNKKETEQLNTLTDILKPDNFKGVCNRMRDMGLRTGFNILLYGPPGGGKSESCMQLAKQSGRDLFKISIEATKSKWHGESEQLIKGLFDRYSKLTETHDIAPIMFLNECDGILSTRVSVQSSVSNTINAMQNLLLEGMESLNGILLATTNLTKNLDKAFERRFLYKIELKKPDSETRLLIWKDKIPGFDDDEYQVLSDEFEFTGGQLENIARKCVLKEILSGVKSSFLEIRGYCQEELLEKKQEHRSVGFRISSG